MKEKMRKSLIQYIIMLLLKKWEIYVADIIEQLKKHDFIIVEWTLYPLLNRLKRDDVVCYEWKESKFGPPRKYYSLTKGWLEILKEMEQEWNWLVKSINNIK